MNHFLSLSLLFVSLLSVKLDAQSNDSLMQKVSEEHNVERQLKNTININPANYMGARKYSITTFRLVAETADTPYELQQKGKGKNYWGAETHTSQTLNHKTLVWGAASYNQGRNKKVVWNENADYDKIYPYVAADSVGGDMKLENYVFSGGYARKFNSYTIGITGKYSAGLSYRDVDPRPKNTTANLSLALGVNKLVMQKFRIGAYLEAEKYTQKHYLSFFSTQGFPMVYTMSGMGNYNELLSGKIREAYYEGWSYGGGIQIFEEHHRNWYLNVGIRKTKLDKYLTAYTDLNASNIDEQKLNFSLGKFFSSGKIYWGLMADGSTMERRGTENLFLNDNSRNYIKVGAAEKYNHRINTGFLKGLLRAENNKNQHTLVPYFGLIQEKEKYSSPLSATKLDRMIYGADYQWWRTFDDHLALSVLCGLSVTDVYDKNAVFNNTNKPTINQMLQDNYLFQSSGFWQAKVDVNFHFSFPVINNAFVGGKMIYSKFSHQHNMLFAFTIGSVF